MATNSGGPHCLAYGVTSTHVLAIEVVLPDGRITMLGGLDPEPAGYDLRGAFIGGEGTLGVATKIAVRLTPIPKVVRTLLLDFASVDDGAATVSAIIAGGLVPAAIEMMDARITAAVEAFVHAGFPLDAAAVLMVEVDGLASAVDDAVERVRTIGLANGAQSVRVAQSEAERALWWKGRKSAFGAIARINPDYYLHDTVVPRRRLVEVLREVYAIAERHDLIVMNVFHAGDGNLHPLLSFDRRVPGTMERVYAAGEEIVKASVAAGGVLSGEHGIGIEKRDLMPMLFSADDLDAQARLREAFDPDGTANPQKVLPGGLSLWRPSGRAGRSMGVTVGQATIDLASFAEEIGPTGPVAVEGGRTQWDIGGSPDPVGPAGARARGHRRDRRRRDDGLLWSGHVGHRARCRARRARAMRRAARLGRCDGGRRPRGGAERHSPSRVRASPRHVAAGARTCQRKDES